MNFDDVAVGDVLEYSPFIESVGMDNTLLTCISREDDNLIFDVTYKGIKICEDKKCDKVNGYWRWV